MRMKNFSGSTGFSQRKSLLMRFLLVAGALLGALALGLTVVNLHETPARAANNNLIAQITAKQPWGEALDNAGHLWVAEPNCDASPVCAAPPTSGTIGEYDSVTMNKIMDFIAPNGVNPVFVAPDSQGNIWFTDPSHALIGKLVPSKGTYSIFSIPGTTPYDLVFDNSGKIWFTDFQNGAVGLFDPGMQKFLGTVKTPTSSVVYGITKGPDGTIWVAENNTFLIASFTPKPTIVGLTLQEHHVLTNQQHLIITDKAGNVWFSTGFNGQIGELLAGSNTPLTFCVSNGLASNHISGVAIDNVGNIWFTDSINARVGTLNLKTYANDCASTTSTAGVTSLSVGAGTHPHDGLITDAAGNVYFTEQFNNSVTKIPSGSTLPPPPTTNPSGPVAKTWYFAEGRVGAGFREFITIGNPSPTNKCIVDITYLRENGTPVPIKVTVDPASRFTEEVGPDLGTNVNGPGISVATIVSNDPTSPCSGIDAERPMYFNYHGDRSGSDVVGATHTSGNFYFADIPRGNGYTSFITILNPPGGQPATVTANYFSNGRQVGQQTLTVSSGMRGTISPGQINLPTHSSAIVTSSQPVIVERPAYFTNISGGFAGVVNGASSVVGSQSLQHEWFLAEGFAGQNNSGGRTQENLVIANIDPAKTPAQVTINLEYIDGSKHAFQVTVAPNSQLVWDVNQQGTNPTSKEVSADIVSTGAGIVVMRQMYFNYAHTINGSTLYASGGTEVTGQVGTFSSYTFAEGYSNTGYNHWLTLQNPTNTAETITIIMVNSLGNSRTVTLNVGQNSRSTFDVTAYVRANMAIIGNTKSYEISMTVLNTGGGQFVAERPLYFNTSNSSFPTQGGTDAFGYSGN
jgi:streptogramin lyase